VIGDLLQKKSGTTSRSCMKRSPKNTGGFDHSKPAQLIAKKEGDPHGEERKVKRRHGKRGMGKGPEKRSGAPKWTKGVYSQGRGVFSKTKRVQSKKKCGTKEKCAPRQKGIVGSRKNGPKGSSHYQDFKSCREKKTQRVLGKRTNPNKELESTGAARVFQK